MTIGLAIATAALRLDTAGPLVGLPRLEHLLESWPTFEIGVETRYFSSFDRSGGNDDGFTGKYSRLFVDEHGEHVIFDADQPGCLYTLWFTSDSGGHGKLNWGKIRFYFDHETKPRMEIEANDLFSGTHAPFLAPLVMDNRLSTGGYACYLPMPFAKSLKITTEQRVGFYNCFYQLYPFGTKIESWTGKEDSAKVRDLWQHAIDGRPVGLPGKMQTVAAAKSPSFSHSGPGSITRLALRSDQPLTQKTLREGRIRCTWDGKTLVDVPIGVFFGLWLDAGYLKSVALYADATKLVSVIPMPFWEGCKIEVEAPQALKLEVSLGSQRWEKARTGYFAIAFNEEHPTETGVDFQHAALSGAGKVIGVAQAIEPGDPGNKGWWEGDVRVYVDGAMSPAIHGTGHEDDFLGGWSNEFLDSPFSLPMHGEPYVKMLDRQGQYNGDCSLYRFFVGVPFGAGLQWSTEHGSENEQDYNYSGAVFTYAGGPSYLFTDQVLLSDPDTRAGHNVKMTNASEAETLTSHFEGKYYKQDVTDKVFSSLGKTEFDVQILPENIGVKLRRRYDQFHGRQRARVLVDGKEVGMWYTAEENTSCRWAERDFFIPAAFTKGKAKVHITIDPPPSSPLFSHARYTVLSLQAPEK